MTTNTHFWYLAQFFLEWETLQTEVAVKIKRHSLFSLNLYRKPTTLVSWSSGQSFWLLITRTRVRFPAMPWGFSLGVGVSPWWPWSALLNDLCTFVVISRWIILRIRNDSDKGLLEIETHISYMKRSSRNSCRLWDNVENCSRVRMATDENITRHVLISCWITQATDTHS